VRSLAVFVAMVITPSLSAPPGAPLRFACSVTGEKLLEPPTTAPAICEAMQASLARAMGKALQSDAKPIAADDRNGWMRVTIVFTKAGVASAKLEHADKDRVFVYPAANVAVSDRAPDIRVVEILATELARAIDAGTGRS
jgi:hypothetical protein